SSLVEGFTKLMPRQLAEGLEQRDVKVASDDRRSDEHSLRRLAQAFQAAADETAHALGQLEVLLGEAGQRAPAATEHALGRRHVKEGVLDKQGIALRGRLD